MSVSSNWARGRRRVPPKWPVSGGIVHAAMPISGSPSAASTRKGTPQPKRLPSAMPMGTPTTDATANADISKPVARPRRSSGNTSATMAYDKPPNTPPNAPVRHRAATSSW